MVFLVALAVVVVLAGLWVRHDIRTENLRDRLLAGHEEALADDTPLWRDALELFQVEKLRRLLDRSPYARSFQNLLFRAGLPQSLPRAVFVLIVAGSVVGAGLWIGFRRIDFSLGGALGLIVVLLLVLRGYAHHRVERLERQLPGLVAQMIANLRSGSTPLASVRNASRHAPKPVGPSMGEVVHAMELGRPAADAWRDWAARWDSPACRLLSTGVRIKWETGGEMSSILEFILDALESRRRMELRIQTLTAQARLSTWVLLALPFVIGLITWSLNPTLFEEMLADPTGQDALAACGVLMIVGYFWLRRIANLRR